jgi:prepilin-type N-terminal cleavage/methylation domain-containing protein
MKKNYKSAFSLIELSIVILIIGILIAGVTQATRLVTQARLNSARTITQSSPVGSIKDLYLWLETTSEKSFDDAETQDNNVITNWYDINPQSPSKFTLTEGTTANKPTYKSSLINGLPALTFDGVNDRLTSTINFGITGNPAFTIFSVVAVNGGANYGTWVYWGTSGNGKTLVFSRHTATTEVFAGFFGSGQYFAPTTGAITNTTIYSWVRQAGGTTLVGNSLYSNGAVQTLSNENAASTPDFGVDTFKVGYTNDPVFFGGNIAEIIIFTRDLKTEERRAVEAYLGKKWGIKVS